MNEYSFQNPDDKYRGLDLWMVNDNLSDEEIKKQVYEFKKKGFYSVVFRTYNGLVSDYPGPLFKSKLRAAVDSARECGLKIALQAGYMPSAYPNLPPEYALHRIVPTPISAIGEGDVVLATYGDIAFLDKIAPATVNMLSASAVDYYIRTAYEESWAEFADEYGKTSLDLITAILRGLPIFRRDFQHASVTASRTHCLRFTLMLVITSMCATTTLPSFASQWSNIITQECACGVMRMIFLLPDTLWARSG